jgi:crotonobetainyl-CoA:carnitine CoA-transferase CaiB-like acyl-CoA transferase
MPLSQFRILQIGSGIALDYCGKLFSDFGADVVKLEPPGGDPMRSFPPVLQGGQSGLFAWLNTNKRSVTETHAALDDLVPGADLLLDGRALCEHTHPSLAWPGLSQPSAHDPLLPVMCAPTDLDAEADARKKSRPGISVGNVATAYTNLSTTTISWFGGFGPYANFAATEATARALGGLVALTGRAEGPPTLATDCQSGIIAGLAAFIASAAGLYDRGSGSRHFSVSIHETAVNVAEYEAAVAWDAGASRKRPGVNRFGRNYPVGIYPTKQGLIGVTIVTPSQWRGICAMLGMPDLAKDTRYAVNTDRLANAREIDTLFQPVWDTRTAMEWFELALEYKLPMAVVPTMAELLEQHVHRARGAFVPVRIGDVAFEAPVLPQHLLLTPPRTGGTAPLAGEDHAAWFIPPSSGRPTGPAPEKALPLRGLSIIDLTMGWAGPTAARHLSELGAEIIKVEACQYPDWWRGTDLRASFIAEQKYEKIPWFQLMNRNKLDLTLDLTNPAGVALLKRLVTGADAVIENYSSEVLSKLGLDYTVLKDVKPGLVMLSMPAFGSHNAWSACRGYGSTLEQASGLPTITGFPEDPPTMNQTAYGDPVGGFNAAAALMVALLHKQATGQGQNIDLSQVECMLPLVAPALIEQSAADRTPPRAGNRHPLYIPQGCFRCTGNDAWIAISVTSDAMWRALCGLLNQPGLSTLTTPQRRDRQDALEARIGAWTAARDPGEAMATLQAHGIAAGMVRTPLSLVDDPHLVAREFWHRLDRPFIGPHWQSSAAFREGRDAYPVRRAAPTLGQDNEAILCGRLGLSREEFDRLTAADVIGTVPKPRRAQSDQ